MAEPSQELIDQYKQLLVNLLPPGRLWQPKAQPKFAALLRSMAVELARADLRVKQMLLEIDPRTCDETIDLWGELLNLPDECSPAGQSFESLRTQILQKLTNIGGISKEFYEFIGLQFGYEIEVKNWVNFVAGRARAGDPLTNYFDRHFVAGSLCGMQLREVGWLYYFNVDMPATAATHFVAGSLAGEPLRSFSNPLIECTMRKLKPANAGVTFTFRE